MDYKSLKIDDLAKLASDRRLTIPTRQLTGQRTSSRLLRNKQIQALERADKAKQFRFLDLTAEMRNAIYGELLSFDVDAGRSCSPSILATCKQVHSEASQLINAGSVVKVVVGPLKALAHGHSCGAYSVWFGGTPSVWLDRLKWPDYLRRVWNLKIIYDPNDDEILPDTPMKESLISSLAFNNVLYSFCCFLKDGSDLKTIEVDISELPVRPSLHQEQNCLEPLQLLGAVHKLTVRDSKCITTYSDTSYPASIVLAGAALTRSIHLAKEYLAFYELWRGVHGAHTDESAEASVSVFDNVQELLNGCLEYWDAEREQKLLEGSRALEQSLDLCHGDEQARQWKKEANEREDSGAWLYWFKKFDRHRLARRALAAEG